MENKDENFLHGHSDRKKEKVPERDFPSETLMIRLKIVPDQRLLNWGARRAAFKPYSMKFSLKKSLFFKAFWHFLRQLSHPLAPPVRVYSGIFAVCKSTVYNRSEIFGLIVLQFAVDIHRCFGILMPCKVLHRLWINTGINQICDVGMTQHIKSGEFRAVLPKNHPLAEKKTLVLEDLAEEPFLLLEEGAYSEPLEAFRAAGITPNVKLRVHDDYSILSMVEQGLGISILTELVLHKTSYDVVTLPIEPAIMRTMSIVAKDKNTLPLASKEFIRYLTEYREALI